MTRSGMFELIRQLRQMTQAADDEYSLAGETYFTDDHLQDALDQYRADVYEEAIYPIERYISGATVYQDYFWNNGNVERAESGSAVWQLQDTNGSAVGTANYSVDYNVRRIRFGTPTDGSQYALTYAHYDMNRAAAYVWRLKAANVALRFDVKTDNHDLKRSQLRKTFIEMAEHYDKLAQQNGDAGAGGGRRMKEMFRVDMNG